jgi:ComF family protein
MIHRWKYQEKSHLTPLFGEWLQDALIRHWPSSFFDLIVPVPLHVKRLRRRGFNQALLLAKALSRKTGIPYGMRVLRKKKATPPQVNLSRREREREIRGAFFVKDPSKVKGKTVLLVDDVMTTGATVNECSKVLRVEGASSVHVLTLGRTLIGL